MNFWQARSRYKKLGSTWRSHLFSGDSKALRNYNPLFVKGTLGRQSASGIWSEFVRDRKRTKMDAEQKVLLNQFHRDKAQQMEAERQDMMAQAQEPSASVGAGMSPVMILGLGVLVFMVLKKRKK